MYLHLVTGLPISGRRAFARFEAENYRNRKWPTIIIDLSNGANRNIDLRLWPGQALGFVIDPQALGPNAAFGLSQYTLINYLKPDWRTHLKIMIERAKLDDKCNEIWRPSDPFAKRVLAIIQFLAVNRDLVLKQQMSQLARSPKLIVNPRFCHGQFMWGTETPRPASIS